MKNLFLILLFSSLFPICGYAFTADEYYHAGFADYQAGKWNNAIPLLENAIQQDPNYWEAYQILAYSYYRLNDIQKCLRNGDASIRIHPNNPTLQNFIDKLKTQNLPAPSVDNQQNNSAVVNPTPIPTLPPIPMTNGSTTPTNIASSKKNSFYFNLSAVTPDYPNGFSTDWTSGGSVGIAYGIDLNKMTSIVLSGQYSTFPFNYTYPGLEYSGGSVHTVMFLVNGKFILVGAENPVAFYVITGLGPTDFIIDTLTATNISTSQTQTYTSTYEADFSLRLGMGIDIKLNKGVALYIESNGVDTFVSQKVATEGYTTNNMFSIGMKFDE